MHLLLELEPERADAADIGISAYAHADEMSDQHDMYRERSNSS